MPLSGECMSLDKNTNLFLALNPNVTLKQMSSCVSKCFIKFYCNSWFTKTHLEVVCFFLIELLIINYRTSIKGRYLRMIWNRKLWHLSVQFSSVAQSCPTICDPMNHSTPGLPVHHQLPEFTQTHVQWVGDAIQPSHPMSSSSPPALNLCQHQSLFKWVSSLHQVAKVLEFQLQHQSFHWTPRTDLL